MRLTLFTSILFLLLGCSGYRLVSKHNPLAQYGIKSIAIPMFENSSNIPNVSGHFTSEFHRFFAGFRGVKIYSKYNEGVDAILLGIIGSPKRLRESLRPGDQKIVTTLVNPSDIGGRADFFVPIDNQVNMTLRLVLIKNPTKEDVQLVKSRWGEMIEAHPRILIDRTHHMTGSLNLQFLAFGSSNEGGQTNFTNNQGNLDKLMRTFAEQSKEFFKDIVVYAF